MARLPVVCDWELSHHITTGSYKVMWRAKKDMYETPAIAESAGVDEGSTSSDDARIEEF